MSGQCWSHVSLKKILLKHFLSEIVEFMQRHLAGDHQDEDAIEPMNSVNPVVLDGGCHLRLLVVFDYFPNVSHFWHKHTPFLDRRLPHECI